MVHEDFVKASHWNATGGASLFELYTSLKKGGVRKKVVRKSKTSRKKVVRKSKTSRKKVVRKSKTSRKKVVRKSKASRKKVVRKSKTSRKKVVRKSQRGGEYAPYLGNPPYGLSTSAHAKGQPAGKVAPIGMKIFERSFQGPFPNKSKVEFDYTTPFENGLIVEPVPKMTGGKKVVKRKKSVKKSTKKVVKRKKSVKKSTKKVVKRKKSVKKSTKKVVKRKKSVKKSVKKSTKKSKRKVKRSVMRGG